MFSHRHNNVEFGDNKLSTCMHANKNDFGCYYSRCVIILAITFIHSFIHSSSDYCHICIDMHMNVFKWKSFCFTSNNEYCCARTHTQARGFSSWFYFLPFQQPHMPSFIIISPVETTANGMNAKLVIEHRRRFEWFANAKNDMSFRNYN